MSENHSSVLTTPAVSQKTFNPLKNNTTYEYKAPKIMKKSGNRNIKLKTKVRASIETLLVGDNLNTPNVETRASNFSVTRDSLQNQKQNLEFFQDDNKDQPNDSLLLKSTIVDQRTSLKSSFLDDHIETSPQPSLNNKKSNNSNFSKRKSSSFSNEKMKSGLSNLKKEEKKSSIGQKSKESSPIKSSSNKDKKVFNFAEKNNVSANNSLLKEIKNDQLRIVKVIP